MRGLAWFAGRDATGERGDRLRACGRAFALGFNAYGLRGNSQRLGTALAELDPDERGLAVEGAAMAAGMSGSALPRLRRLLDGPGAQHPYTAYVGVGWAAAMLGRPRPRGWQRMDPLLRWLALDGAGFCTAFFRRGRTRRGATGRAGLRGNWTRVHDQGVGRALWFVTGAQVDQAAAVIATASRERAGDLWSGLALAAVYAGGVTADETARLLAAARPWRADIAQGAAFGAKARLLGGAGDEEADRRVRALAGCDLVTAAAATDTALATTTGDGSLRDYLAWRASIRSLLADDPAPSLDGGDP